MIGNALPKSILDNPALACWISLDLPGRILIRSGKVELGQGNGTALAQIAAEELQVGIERIYLSATDTDRSPDEGLTAGSQSIEISGAALRLTSAQARMTLLDAAAARLGVENGALSCRDGGVLMNGVATGLDFWSLATDINWQQPITGQAPLRPVRNYEIVGRSPPRNDMQAKLCRGGFIHDMSLDGMLHARVIRQPFRLARLAEIDTTWLARRHPDVTVLRRADFLALIGQDEYGVHRAHAAAEEFVSWEEVPGLWKPAATSGEKRLSLGNALPQPTSNLHVISARYSRPYLAHASIGPSCALAHFEAGRLTVWTHSQGIFSLRNQIANCLHVDVSAVRVVHMHGSGCYGHNGADDAALDAAIIAMECRGQPVRIQWSRMDELSRSPLGAAMSTEIDAELDDNGRVGHWKLSTVSSPHAQRPGFGGYANLSSAEALESGRLPAKVEDLPEAASGGAARNAVAIYDFPNQDVRIRLDTRSAVRTSSLRSLGAHLNVFAIESAMDELADLGGADPLNFRLRQLSDARCRAVLKGVAEMCGWPENRPTGEGRAWGIGVARYKNKGAWLAAVAEVSAEDEIRVERLWLCVDAGLLINPAGARSQIEGGAIQAVSWTLKEKAKVEGDRVSAMDWLSYPILKFSEIPPITTKFIVDPTQPPLGAGEAAQGPVSAAIGNAASRALGVRMRHLPFTRDRLIESLMAE